MTYYGYEFIRESDITHHGILGQKWGVRRFQNKDGTLTAAGKNRRSRKEIVEARKTINSEKQKLRDLQKRKDSIELDTEYRDDIYDLLLEAKDSWNEKEDRPDSEDESNAKWKRYEDAYRKALSSNKEYPRIVEDLEKQKIKVKELENAANTKSGEDYLKATLGAIGSISAALAGFLVVDYLMTRR